MHPIQLTRDKISHHPSNDRITNGLHNCRCSTKRARYASEAMAPAIGKKASRFAKQMKQVQSVLGDHQDTVIARQVERELGITAHLAGENAFSYGLLYGHDTPPALQPPHQPAVARSRPSTATAVM